MLKTNNAKIAVGYLIDEEILKNDDLNQYVSNISSYISDVDKMYIYQTCDADLSFFYEKLNTHNIIEFAKMIGAGEAEVYQELVNKAINDGMDYVTYVRPSNLYEEDTFHEIKKYLLTADMSKVAVLTPMPLLACELHERKAEEYRLIKGCRLTGAMLNLHIYPLTRGIKTEYYHTTFDYDYCLQVRLLGYDVMLAQNLVYRNQNYHIITKRLLLIKMQMFDRKLMDVYYETRNRLYLWEEYKDLDPDYVKLDKRLYKQEVQEMRHKDKRYLEKQQMIIKAKLDYEAGKLGKYSE